MAVHYQGEYMIRRLYNVILLWFVSWGDAYDQGWTDGWNACRATPPDLRVYKVKEPIA